MTTQAAEGVTFLMDANVLIAMTVRDHVKHDAAHRWLAGVDRFAMCPITEGALVRFLVREGESAAFAQAALSAIRDLSKCEFWGDDVSYRDVDLSGVYGHRQVTDSYLVGLAAHRSAARVATFDRALAARQPQWCDLIRAE